MSVHSTIIKKGYAVIFDQRVFDNQLNLKSRTDEDAFKITETFKQFNISFKIIQDSTLEGIDTEVNNMKHFTFEQIDCFIIIVLTHGKDINNLYAKDGIYSFYEKVVYPIIFDKRNINKLEEKPKLFIIQACKSGLPNSTISTDSLKYRMPVFTNMFFAVSTYKDTDLLGGHFIIKFCDTLKKYSHILSINDIMERISGEINNNNKTAVPTITITKTLSTRVFFDEIEKDMILESALRLTNGYAVIFNQEKFHPSLPLNERVGTAQDVHELRRTLQYFNINVDNIQHNLTISGIEKEVEKLKRFDFTAYDCFICVVLSHGENNNNVYSYDQLYNLYDIIVNPIIQGNKYLIGKTKLFLVQACRGEYRPITDDIEIFVGPEENSDVHPDTFYAFATFPEYVSYRNTLYGTFFIQRFCKELHQNWYKMSINDLIEIITERLATNYDSPQVPTITKTTTKPIVFQAALLKPVFRLTNGYAIIFNNDNFHPDLKLSDRIDATQVVKLKNTLENFNVTVDIKENLTLREIEAEVECLRYFDFTTFDCLMIVILTRSEMGNVLYAQDYPYNLYLTIVNPILSSNKSLKNKPKIFIIQASKGVMIEKPSINLTAVSEMYIAYSFTINPTTRSKDNLSFIRVLNDTLQTHGFSQPISVIMENVNGINKNKGTRQVLTESTMSKPFKFIDIAKAKELGLKNGLCIIFNQECFEPNLEFRPMGMSPTIYEFKKTLENFNIIVEIKENLKLNEIESEVEKLKSIDLSEYDCFMIIISSLGEENSLLYAFDEKFNFYEKIVNPITHSNKTLENKPKIFIIQSQANGIFQDSLIQTDSKLKSPPKNYMPDASDMLLLFSTYKGFVNHNDIQEEEILIKKFCDTLEKYGYTESIALILERVSKEINVNKEFYQIPTIRSTLSSQFCFTDVGKEIIIKKLNTEKLKKGYGIIFYMNKDITELKETFENFNINVNLKQNLSLQDIRNEVKNLSEMNFNSYNCFVMTLIAHSSNENEHMLCAGDESYEFFEDVLKPICLNKTLEGKQKLIMIYASSSKPYRPNIMPNIPNITFAVFPSQRGNLNCNSLIISMLCRMLQQNGSSESIENIITQLSKNVTGILKDPPIIFNKNSKPFVLGDIGK